MCFRKALRATFVLIPLFGVQLVVTVYRPVSPSSIYYERFSEFVTNSQVKIMLVYIVVMRKHLFHTVPIENPPVVYDRGLGLTLLRTC